MQCNFCSALFLSNREAEWCAVIWFSWIAATAPPDDKKRNHANIKIKVNLFMNKIGKRAQVIFKHDLLLQNLNRKYQKNQS